MKKRYRVEGWAWGRWKHNVDDVFEVEFEEEVVLHVKQHWDKIDYEINRDPNQLHEANLLKLDCSKAHIKLHWKDVWDSEKTFEKTVKWYKSFYEHNKLLSEDDLQNYVQDAKEKNIEWTQK